MPRKRMPKCVTCKHARITFPHYVGSGPNYCNKLKLIIDCWEKMKCKRYAKKAKL